MPIAVKVHQRVGHDRHALEPGPTSLGERACAQEKLNRPMRLELRTPAENRRGPEHTEQLLAVLHQSLLRQGAITLGLHHRDEVRLWIEVEPTHSQLIRNGLHAAYPNIELSEAEQTSSEHATWFLYLNPDLFPLKPYQAFPNDRDEPAMPLDGLLQTLAGIKSASVEITLQRASKREIQQGLWVAHHCSPKSLTWNRHPVRWKRWISHLRRTSAEPDEAIMGKLAHPHLFQVQVRLRVTDLIHAQELAAQFAPYLEHQASSWLLLKHRPRPFLLTSQEVASLWHPPVLARTEQLGQSEFTQLEPPAQFVARVEEGVLLGETCFRERHDPVILAHADRLRHLHVVGKTGTGKSTLLYNMLVDDLRSGRGVALIDPHGDLADAVLAAIPRHRTRDAVVVDPGDRAFPVAFNLLDCPQRSLEPLVASGIVSSFKKLNADSWGPRLEDILRNSVRALLEQENTTLVSLLRLLTNDSYRQHMTRQIRDPTVREYWQVEFPAFDKRYRTEAIGAVTNKIRPFLAHPILRNVVGQAPGKIHLREIMDEGRILIVKLSKGVIGEDAVGLLGSMLVTNLQVAAMSRADIAESGRKPFFAYIDEFQNFATDSFATILSEARKYKLGLTLSHQFIDQLEETIRSAVFGNVDNLLCFRAGAADAEQLANEFGDRVSAQEIARLPLHTAFLRMLCEGITTRPFTIRTLPPPHIPSDRTAKVRAYSRNRYARTRSVVQRQLAASYKSNNLA